MAYRSLPIAKSNKRKYVLSVLNKVLQPMKTFENLEIWKESRNLSKIVYSSFFTCKDYAFKDQICRASVSVMNNIAEGFDRSGDKEFVRFLYIAKGSCSEVKSMSYLAKDLGYLDQKDFGEISGATSKLNRRVGALIKKISTDIKKAQGSN